MGLLEDNMHFVAELGSGQRGAWSGLAGAAGTYGGPTGA